MTVRTIPGIAKVAGLIVCIVGVATLAFYRGPQLKPAIQHPFFDSLTNQEHEAHVSSGQRWILGCFLLSISIISWGLWLVLQVTRLIRSQIRATQLETNIVVTKAKIAKGEFGKFIYRMSCIIK